MNYNLPIEFLWGTFCRRGIVDSRTGTASMIDIIPGLRIASQIDAKTLALDHPQMLNIPFGNVAAFALFGRTNQNPSERQEKIAESLIVDFSIPGSGSQSSEIPILIEPEQDSTFVIFAFENASVSVPFEEGFYKQLFEVDYKLKEFDLGKINLPVYITVGKE